MMLWRSIFGLRLLDRAANHASCHNYPGVNQARELWHLQCWSSNQSNTLKDASMEWMKLGCLVPAFPLGPKHSQLWVGASQGLKNPT